MKSIIINNEKIEIENIFCIRSPSSNGNYVVKLKSYRTLNVKEAEYPREGIIEQWLG